MYEKEEGGALGLQQDCEPVKEGLCDTGNDHSVALEMILLL